MKKLLYFKTMIFMFAMTVSVSATYATDLPTEWRYNGAAGVLTLDAGGNTSVDNGAMTWENGIWRIETYGKPFYPRIRIPLTNISGKPTLKLRMRCTSDDYVFLWTTIRGKSYYNPAPTQVDNKTQEIDSEGNWKDITVDFSDVLTSTMPNYLDTIGYVQISFRGTAGANNWIRAVVEVDEMVLGGELSTGIHESTLEAVNVFPTIATDNIKITAPIGKNANIEVFNVIGAKIFSRGITDFQGNTNINIEDFPEGSYILNLIIDGKKSVHRFIKQ